MSSPAAAVSIPPSAPISPTTVVRPPAPVPELATGTSAGVLLSAAARALCRSSSATGLVVQDRGHPVELGPERGVGRRVRGVEHVLQRIPRLSAEVAGLHAPPVLVGRLPGQGFGRYAGRRGVRVPGSAVGAARSL